MAPVGTASVLLAAMADGIGDLAFASKEWVDAAREALDAAITKHADGLSDLSAFTTRRSLRRRKRVSRSSRGGRSRAACRIMQRWPWS